MDGKRVPSMQTGPAAKRGPMDEFDDLIEEDLDNEMPAQLLPDDLGEADVPLAEAGRNWTRPPVTPLNRATQSLGGFELLGKAHAICVWCYSGKTSVTHTHLNLPTSSVMHGFIRDCHVAGSISWLPEKCMQTVDHSGHVELCCQQWSAALANQHHHRQVGISTVHIWP